MHVQTAGRSVGRHDYPSWPPPYIERPGGLAEFERELIKARTSEGRARAKLAGVRMGRKPKLALTK